MRVLVIGFLMMICFGNFSSKAQDTIAIETKTSAKAVLRKDSSVITLRQFDEKAIDRYRAQKEFVYADAAPQELSLFQRFWRWFWSIFDSLYSGKTTGKVIKYVLTALVIILFVYIIIKLVGLDYKWLVKKSKPLNIPFEEGLENIHEINFDEQIENAKGSSNYRLAVRLLYLKTLKRLSDEGLIVWKIEKTNLDYVMELINDHQKNDFKALTYQFEYIWYGDFFIDKDSFERISNLFNQFNRRAT